MKRRAPSTWPRPYSSPRIVGRLLAEVWRTRLWHPLSPQLEAPVDVPARFVGVNIATQEDPACDDAVLERVKALGLACVRLNFGYDDIGGAQQRLLGRALDEGMDVLLNMLPPPDSARKMARDEKAQQRWQQFVERVCAQYSGRAVCVEIGNTINRKKWSGWDYWGYQHAWSIAQPIVARHDIPVAAANVSDFEPLFNLAHLDGLRQHGAPPDRHTDNLFVERVVQPEVYDHRFLGRLLGRVFKFNLVKKARTLQRIGHSAGIANTLVSYTTWTMQRLARWSDQPENKQADYLARYLLLAAASGALSRVYWGPLIDHRDGIVDDSGLDPDHTNTPRYWAEYARQYPQIDHVCHYPTILGERQHFRERPAFYALKKVQSVVCGARLEQGVSAKNGVSCLVFGRGDREIHACWCWDGYTRPVAVLYPALPDDVVFYDELGQRLDGVPASFGEQVMYLHFSAPASAYRPAPEAIRQLPDLGEQNIHWCRRPGWQPLIWENENWRGAVAFQNPVAQQSAIASLQPEALLELPVAQVLRDSRNRIWACETSSHGAVAVKLNRVNKRKRVAYMFRDSKARRHWNNANVMRRMGVNTPQPLAFFERHQASGTSESYYVCAYVANAFSARDVFNHRNEGGDELRGHAFRDLLRLIAEFICTMHNRGILHRDLSPGNILLVEGEAIAHISNQAGAPIQACVIDIGRARTGLTLTPRQRLIDLIRICFILSWSDRESLISYYDEYLGRPVARWWKWAVRYYVFKIEAKRTLRRKR